MAKKEKGAKPQQAEKKKAKSQSGALLYAAAAAAVAIGAVWMASRGPLAPSSPPNPAAATSRPGRPPSPSGPDGGKRAVSECTDNSPACQQWANLGECEKNPKFMHVECTKTCGACKGTKVERQCQDDNADCERWALTGQCVKNSEFMMANCRKSCGVCGPFGPACERKGAAAITPGDIKTTFERAVADFPQYSPEVLHTDPWVVRFDNFVSDEEADRIIELCQEAFQRSLAGDQVSPVRTSTQCWCNFPKCLQDPMLMAVEQRVANLTRVPVTNGEFMQVVRYDEGQFYKEHHDQNSASWSPQGVRVYTFFMYLNDVEEGGETAFSRLDLKVRPRKGSAILWPSVLDSDPNATEPGTYHAALPVGKGLKYGANLWLHMHDFRTPSYHHCLFTMKNTVE